MKLTAIVRGRLYEYPIGSDDARDMALNIIASNHSVFHDTYNGVSGRFRSSNDYESIVGHYIITEG